METRNRNTPRPVDLADRIEAAGYGTAIGQCAADDADWVRWAGLYSRDASGRLWFDDGYEYRAPDLGEISKVRQGLEGAYKRVSRALRTQAGREYLRRGDLREIDKMIRDLKAVAA